MPETTPKPRLPWDDLDYSTVDDKGLLPVVPEGYRLLARPLARDDIKLGWSVLGWCSLDDPKAGCVDLLFDIDMEEDHGWSNVWGTNASGVKVHLTEDWRYFRLLAPGEEVPPGEHLLVPFKTVAVESPYAGDTEEVVEFHRNFLRKCLADCLRRGEAPFASHGLYTQPGVLYDRDPAQRRRGIQAGFALGARLDYVVVYCDYGISPGMRRGIEAAQARGQRVVMRWLYFPGIDIPQPPTTEQEGEAAAAYEEVHSKGT